MKKKSPKAMKHTKMAMKKKTAIAKKRKPTKAQLKKMKEMELNTAIALVSQWCNKRPANILTLLYDIFA